MEKIIKNLEELNFFAKELLSFEKNVFGATIFGLYGNLGAGKTTLTQNIAKELGVMENISSPTFVIMKIYELLNQKWKHLIHIDAYRIENEKEILSLGFNQIISDENNLIIIEWPEKIASVMPKHTKVFLEFLNENERNVKVEK